MPWSSRWKALKQALQRPMEEMCAIGLTGSHPTDPSSPATVCCTSQIHRDFPSTQCGYKLQAERINCHAAAWLHSTTH